MVVKISVTESGSLGAKAAQLQSIREEIKAVTDSAQLAELRERERALSAEIIVGRCRGLTDPATLALIKAQMLSRQVA